MHRQKTIAGRILCANLKTPVFTTEKIYPLTFNAGAQTLLRNYRIYGAENSVGDLVTDTEDENYGKYKISVMNRGKNLLPTPTFSTFTKNGVKFTNNKDGTITVNGTPTAYTATPNMYLPDSTLEILRNNVCVLTGFYYYEKNISLVLAIGLNGNWIKYIYLNSYTYKNYVKVDLTNVEFDTVVFAVRVQNNDILIDNLTVKPLLEVGTTMPTSFEPYIAPVKKYIYLNEPLRKLVVSDNISLPGLISKAEDYADYIDFKMQGVKRYVAQSGGLFYTLETPVFEEVYIPAIAQHKNTNILTADTAVQPSGMEAKYI